MYFLITRPKHDPATRYLFYWSDVFIKFAKSKGVEVIELCKEKANRHEFEGRIEKLDPYLVVLNGHGSHDEVTGHDNKLIVKFGENDGLLRNRITYAVSCDSGKTLGIGCVDSKTAYIGYDEKFIISCERMYLNDPLKDKRAARFLESSNQVVLSLLKGQTAGEASKRSKETFRHYILDLLTSSNKDPDSLDDVKSLYWDMMHQVCYGNDTLKAI